MARKLLIGLMLVLGGLSATGCAPLIGAGAVIIADEEAERQGGNLF